MVAALKGGERREILAGETWDPEKAPASCQFTPILLADAQFEDRPARQLTHDIKDLPRR
jgi:hypothetical protein